MKTLKFEFQKLRLRKSFLKTTLIILIFLILSMFFSFSLIKKGEYNKLDSINDQIDIYQNQLQFIEEELTEEGLTDIQVNNLSFERLKLEFLIETQTYDHDYLQIEDFDSKHMIHSGSSLMMFIFHITYYIVPLFTIIVSIYTFSSEIQSKTIKNLLASDESRSDIFKGKVIFQSVLVFSAMIVLLFIAFICGLTDTSAEFLISGLDGYYSMSCLSSFALQSIGLIVFVSIILLTTNLIILFTRSTTYTVTILAWIFVLLLLGYYFFEKHIDINNLSNSINSADYTILFNVEYYFKYIQIKTLYWSLGYIMFAFVLFQVQKSRFLKMDY